MNEKNIIRVRQVMKTEFDMVDGLDTVEQALKTMAHRETRALVVKKRYDDDEYGIVMISDIARRVLAQDKAPDRVNIYEVMSKPVVTIHPEMDIRYAARLFARFDLTRAPVLDDKRNIIGIVSLTDMVFKGMLHRLDYKAA
ncbi:MAG: CBS domain-containing protein [Gammaproteobacteria bacterium]|nr:CBS domain-containing protein [Gammaproteobacteria bacterium]MBU1655800.1 CBS domain-containing protein [Gammaproteobacteria bacterium]MBU1962085.1 CBS domain-containing protein [Gammaproteobacteria bacterium]